MLELGRIIEAELVGAPVPDDLTMEEFADADTSAQVLKWLNRTYLCVWKLIYVSCV